MFIQLQNIIEAFEIKAEVSAINYDPNQFHALECLKISSQFLLIHGDLYSHNLLVSGSFLCKFLLLVFVFLAST